MPDGIAQLLIELIQTVKALAANLPAVPDSVDVQCTEGCQSSNPVGWIGLGVATLGLLLAGFAGYAAWRTLGIARTEHVEFMKKINARAKGSVSLDIDFPIGAGRLIETHEEKITLRWLLGFDNKKGDKLAAQVGINFLYPEAKTISASWSRPNGLRVDPSADVLTTDETLKTSHGGECPASYLERERRAVGTRTSYVSFITMEINLAKLEPGDELVIPVKFKIWSDDFPDEAPEVVKLDEVVISKKERPKGRTPIETIEGPSATTRTER